MGETAEAIRSARKKLGVSDTSIPLEARGRIFESHGPPVNLLADERGDRTEGEIRIVLPLEEANPDEAHLMLGPAHVLEPEVPVENVLAFVDEIKRTAM